MIKTARVFEYFCNLYVHDTISIKLLFDMTLKGQKYKVRNIKSRPSVSRVQDHQDQGSPCLRPLFSRRLLQFIAIIRCVIFLIRCTRT